MIRIHLGTEGLGNIQTAPTPDFGAELAAAGRRHALSRERPAHMLGQLYSHQTCPDLAGGVTDRYLRQLFLYRDATPFTRALADGDGRANDVLAKSVRWMRRSEVEPRHFAISAEVAATAAAWSQTGATEGASALLNGLGQGIGLRGRRLELPTVTDTDVELAGRPLVLQPVAMGQRIFINGSAGGSGDPLVVCIPIDTVPKPDRPHAAPLTGLLGPARAAALRAVVAAGGLTGRQLAAALAVSDASASRHIAVLRAAGLVRTTRTGQAVRHTATALGHQLVITAAGPPAF